MAYVHPAWVEHQRKRFTRCDAQRYWGPDVDRLVPKDVLKALGWQDPYEAKANSASASQHSIADDEAPETQRVETLREIAALRWELALLRFRTGGTAPRRALHPHHSQFQPRVPAGNPDGGEWTDGDVMGGQVRIAQGDGPVLDGDGRPHYKPGGHHEMPEAVHKRWKNLPPETRQVFRRSNTGRVGGTIRTSPDAPPQGNFWHGEGGLHRAYNQGVEELSDKFIKDHRLNSDGSDMTPNHAHAILKLIRESEDPRIRDFNLNIRRIQRLRRLRGGGGDD
jgi:hypothetical protein